MNKLSLLALPLTCALHAGQAMAVNTCHYFETTPFSTRANATLDFTRDLPAMHVPRHAPVGSVIAQFPQIWVRPAQMLALSCDNDGSDLIPFDVNATQPPASGFGGPYDDGFTLRTNIPGIGVRVELFAPFTGLDSGEFDPIGRNPPLIPFRALHQKASLGIRLGILNHALTLVKVGELQPGVHQIDSLLANGFMDFDSVGHVFSFRLRGTVIQSQCTVPDDAVSANPVDLGSWSRQDFTHAGYTTTPTAFQINLSACQTDPQNSAFATLELQGADGSQPIDADQGLFSLTSDSQAEGIGIQLLKEDGTPLPLGREERLVPLVNGLTTIKLGARFYQTGASSEVRAGSAKGALNFTVRYR